MRHAVVLAGGLGTRLWPLSTARRPKQLAPLADGRSLLDLAAERAAAVAGANVWLATGQPLLDAAGGAVAGFAPERVIVEPSGRDTLAAVCLAMATIAAVDPDAVVVVLTADHVITPLADLVATLEAGLALADHDSLVTFGVVPTSPETGFGWLELGAARGSGHKLTAFREKPPLALAEQMLAAGPQSFLWNSGMFAWRVDTLLRAAAAFAPQHVAAAQRLAADPAATADWEALPKLSVDHGVMEPASTDPSLTVLAVPLAADWRDVGSWTAYADLIGRDAAGNAITGAAVVLESTDCVVVSDDPSHVVALLGVDGLVVVRTADATLVCRADDVQRVKALQALVADQHPERA